MWVSNGQALPLAWARLAPQGLRLDALKGCLAACLLPTMLGPGGGGTATENGRRQVERGLSPTLRPCPGGGSSKPNAYSAHCAGASARTLAALLRGSRQHCACVPGGDSQSLSCSHGPSPAEPRWLSLDPTHHPQASPTPSACTQAAPSAWRSFPPTEPAQLPQGAFPGTKVLGQAQGMDTLQPSPLFAETPPCVTGRGCGSSVLPRETLRGP